MNNMKNRFILQFRLLLVSLLGTIVTTSIPLFLIALAVLAFYIANLYPNPFLTVLGISLIYLSLRPLAIYHPRFVRNEFMIKIDMNAHPSFKQLLQSLCIKLNTRMVNEVYINDKLNAGISQVQTIKLIGAKKIKLIIGLPMLCALDADQFKYILGHEVSHLPTITAISNWATKQQMRWVMIEYKANTTRSGWLRLINKFTKWYIPYLTRFINENKVQNEYLADALAAQLLGAKETANTLILFTLRTKWLEGFWKEVIEINKKQTELINPYQLMLNNAKQPITLETAQKYLEELSEKAEANSKLLQTHPSLAQRVAALNQNLTPFEFGIGQSMLEKYFSNHMNTFLAIFDDVWRKSYAYQWSLNYNNYQKYLNYQTQFPLPFEALVDYADLAALFDPLKNAIPIYHQILNQEPQHVLANVKVGSYYLSEQDNSGIDYLRNVLVDENNSLCFTACHIANSYIKKNKLANDKCFKQYLVKNRYRIKYAQAERQAYTCADTFFPHALSNDALMQMNNIFIALDRIKCAYLFKKQVRNFPDNPMFILIVSAPNMQYLTKNNLLQRILMYFPPGSTVRMSIITNYTGNQVLTKVKHFENVCIYEKKVIL